MNPIKDNKLKDTKITRILNLARWAPSGDNIQPWKFEIINTRNFNIHINFDKIEVYDLFKTATLISVGTLLENIIISSSNEGCEVQFNFNNLVLSKIINVKLSDNANIIPDKLHSFIKTRCTQRRPFTKKSLTNKQKETLSNSIGEDFKIIWKDTKKEKRNMANLLFKSGKIRLTIKEAYDVHIKIIEWDKQFSENKIPDQALGLDTLVLKMMKWTLKSWERVEFLNKYFAGTLMPRIKLDYIPGLKCAAHFLLLSNKNLNSQEDYINSGRALMRFWLTSTSLGLQFQPEMTPLIFSNYANENKKIYKQP